MLAAFFTVMTIGNIAFFATAIRLQTKYTEAFDELGLDARLYCYSIKQFAALMQFVVKRDIKRLGDKSLAIAGYTFVCCWVIALLLLVAMMFTR